MYPSKPQCISLHHMLKMSAASDTWPKARAPTSPSSPGFLADIHVNHHLTISKPQHTSFATSAKPKVLVSPRPEHHNHSQDFHVPISQHARHETFHLRHWSSLERRSGSLAVPTPEFGFCFDMEGGICRCVPYI